MTLQHDQPALIAAISTNSTRGPAVTGCATPTSFAGDPNASYKPNPKFTSRPNHLMGAGQSLVFGN
jgi:hypothetical protein